MTIDEMIAVLQAAKTGKQIQRERDWDARRWYDIDFNAWIRFLSRMRVKPEPREWDIAVHKENNRPYPTDWAADRSTNSWERVRVREVLP